MTNSDFVFVQWIEHNHDIMLRIHVCSPADHERDSNSYSHSKSVNRDVFVMCILSS